jgi:Reversibly glycosylated polypeptide
VKTALILTTINVPTVLSLYRAHDPDVRFFVAFDKKTPPEAYSFCRQIPNLHAGLFEYSFACSDLIGWNTISRRNIALLEALKWGAELIVSCDDDNISLEYLYFHHFQKLFEHHEPFRLRDGLRLPVPAGANTGVPVNFDGIMARPHYGKWFDPGSLCFPTDGKPVVQRGFPQQLKPETKFAPVTDAKIGVAQGMILGDPDTSAIDRISRHPQVHQVSELLRSGLVTDPRETYAPLNSQNVAFVRQLAPCFFMVPSFGRYDDIYASLVAQRVMREWGYFVHYGQPFVWQERNIHNLLADLRKEQWGAERILDFAAWLDGFVLPKQVPAVEAMKILFTNLPDWMPEKGKLQELALAWCSDIEGVMK